MAGNAFSKEEIVAYEQLLDGFEKALVLSEHCAVYRTDQTQMERSNDVIWRPMPYISSSFAGTDMTANFQSETQLSVPVQIGFKRSVPWTLSATELRDALQERRIIDSAKQRLSSDVELAILNAAVYGSSLFVQRTTAASGFDDYAAIDAIMNETGVQMGDRAAVVSTRDYNSQAGGLANGAQYQARTFGNPISDEALRRASVGVIAGIETFKSDIVPRITAAAGVGVTISTLAAAGNYYVPKATTVAATGETSNVDNRYQVVTVNTTTNVKAGDSFTIELPINPSTGYRWQVDLPMGYVQVSDEILEPDDAGNIVGQGTAERWVFSADTPGTATIDFKLLPPGSDTPEQSVTFTVTAD